MIASYGSDIMLNWDDMRTKFGYNSLYAIGFGVINLKSKSFINFNIILKRRPG